jgi:hypothetical protein
MDIASIATGTPFRVSGRRPAPVPPGTTSALPPGTTSWTTVPPGTSGLPDASRHYLRSTNRQVWWRGCPGGAPATWHVPRGEQMPMPPGIASGDATRQDSRCAARRHDGPLPEGIAYIWCRQAPMPGLRRRECRQARR